MNRSNWEHVVVAVAVTLAFGLAGYPFTGAIAVIAFLYGRETRDAQKAKSLTDFKMLDPSTWTDDGQLDFFPAVAASMLAAVLMWMV